MSLPGLLSGSTTARVWKSGEDRSRIAVDAPFAEFDVVRDGQDLWTFDSASSDVTHLVLPEANRKRERLCIGHRRVVDGRAEQCHLMMRELPYVRLLQDLVRADERQIADVVRSVHPRRNHEVGAQRDLAVVRPVP